jgi:hypothetical protein
MSGVLPASSVTLGIGAVGKRRLYIDGVAILGSAQQAYSTSFV